MNVDAFLADSVVSAEGKLYVQGAGWNTIYTTNFPTRHSRVGIGVLVRVPWMATNQTHTLDITIENADGHLINLSEAPAGAPPDVTSDNGQINRIRGNFNVGRPPALPAGDEQIVPIAVNIDGLVFDAPGAYSLVISIDGTELERLPLRIAFLVQMPQAVGGR
ncbi:MAG TPA: hypothetical protein VGK51_01100 [Actinomycetota bacterium]|jgi:uncharacterized protein affecting Mg2+/Co2+ transport